MKNAGFIILVVLIAFITYAAYHQPSTLQEVPLTQAISDANAGKYKKIEVNGNQLDITLKDAKHPTLKSFKEEGTGLKQEGLNYNKVAVTIKPPNGTGAIIGGLAINLLPVLLIGGLLYFVLKSAQGQGNQALSFGKSRARLYGNEKDKVSFKSVKQVCRFSVFLVRNS
jgi:cell division protease FtsH